MKKILFLSLLLIGLFASLLVSAEGTSLIPGEEPVGCVIRASFSIGDTDFSPGEEISGENSDWGLICLIGMVHYVTNWIFYILMIVVMVMVLYGAFTFLTSSGDPTKTQKATKIITFAVIGMIVALLSRAIPATVKYITGMG
jgi:magnesium-transporting ATPase (P-type)